MALISDTKVDENNKKEPQEDIELGSFKKDSFLYILSEGMTITLVDRKRLS